MQLLEFQLRYAVPTISFPSPAAPSTTSSEDLDADQSLEALKFIKNARRSNMGQEIIAHALCSQGY